MSNQDFSGDFIEEEFGISFFFEDVEEKLPFEEEKLTEWITQVISSNNYNLHTLNYIFCSDEYLHKINVEYLNHDYYTDIITFDQSDEENSIEGDLYISTERIADNAQQIEAPFNREFCRVIIHGVLHLCGYKDKNPTEAQEMRNAENQALDLIYR